MTAILLQSGGLREYRQLGADGNPVYLSAPQLRAAIKRQLGPDVADYFAIPRRSEDGDRIDWYAPREGDVVPWSAATPEEQRSAAQELLQARERVLATGAQMQTGKETERQAFGRLLEHVMNFPDDSHVFLVNSRPVLVFWGFLRHDAEPGYDAVAALLPVMDAAAPVAPASVAPAAVAPLATRRRFRWWWLLLPLLLLLLLFLLLRGCNRPAGIGLPGLPETGGLPEAPALPEREPAVDLPRRGVDLDGMVPGRGGVVAPPPAGEMPGLPADGIPPLEEAMPAAGEQAPLAEEPPAEETPAPEEIPQPEEMPQPEDVPPPEEPPQPEDIPAPENAVQPPEPVPQAEEAGAPLAIPAEAVRSGSTDFLNGRWRSDASLMDKTGRPIDVEYEFNNGEGVARYKRSDGVVCQGPTSATMAQGRLMISDKGNIRCPDGTGFRKSRVECRVGQGGLADCQGSYTSGEKFSVGMTQAGSE
ncbi:MAG TPA: Breakpoint cluster region protein [Gammaproteobacteria bacterium]|nr:Breakpoint cluster region protein [Gammaproteobacteria bacterium]